MGMRCLVVLLALGWFLLSATAAALASAAEYCQCVLGFKSLHDAIPDKVGACRTNEHHNPLTGDGLQEATGVDGKGGLLVWRKADNWTAYTDGYRTWINGPLGLQSRLNTERLPWEASVPKIETVYYDVRGSTEAELASQLQALGPTDESGQRYHGQVTWKVETNWPRYTNGSCRLNDVRVDRSIRMLLPRWTPPADASSALVDKWNRYLTSLTEHEKGHIEMAIAGSDSIPSIVRGSTCQTAEARTKEAYGRMKEADARFDGATQHGMTQGAVFP